MDPLKLHGRVRTSRKGPVVIARITTNESLAPVARGDHALLASPSAAPPGSGFAAVLRKSGSVGDADSGNLVVHLPEELGYVEDGDVIRVDPERGTARVLYRRRSPHNSLLVTERCNSRCLMCSQPPVTRNDSYLVEELLRTVALMSPDTAEVGITGGEPTLLHGDFLRVITALRDRMPLTAVHVLSNGRLFSYLQYAQRLGGISHPDLMIGIPVYADTADKHDFVVQAQGAFDETVRGILNLARCDVRVEIRVVLHRQTVDRLPQLARFLARNLPFVDHVALMGLEMMGFTRLNLEALWIDPADYQPALAEAVDHLAAAGMQTSIYNHQLCVLDRRLWPVARRSISDWKNVYLPACDGCGVRADCGGFFASATVRHSAHIRALPPQ